MNNIDKSKEELLQDLIELQSKYESLEKAYHSDIIERRQSEEKLQRNKFDLEEAQSLAHIGSWHWSLDTNIVRWSDELYKITGFDPNSKVPPFSEMSFLFTSESWKKLNNAVENTIKLDEPYSLDLEIIRSDGTIINALTRGKTDYDSSGVLIGLHGTVQDITELMQAEQKVKMSEAKYKILFNNIQDGFALHEIIFDVNEKPINYRFLEINPAFEKLTGLKTENLLGKTVLEIMPETEKYWIELYCKVALTGEPVSFENYSKELNKYYRVMAFRPKIGQFAVIFQDITESKKAENAIRDSENKFRSYMDFAPHGIFIVNEMGNYLEVNNAASEITGYAKEELLTMNLIELIAEESLEFGSSQFKQVIEEGFSSGEFAFIRKDKTKRFWSVDAVKLTDQRFLGFVIDITERKLAEAALLESESRFKDIVFSTSDWIWEIDENGKYSYCSNRIEEILGYSVTEIIGKTCFDLMPPEECERVGVLFQNILESKSPIIDLVNLNLHKDGHKVYLLTNGFPILDPKGNVIGYRGADRNITERIKAEEALKESEKQYRTILQTAMDGFWLVNQEGNLLDVNESYCKMSGFSQMELMKMNMYDLEAAESLGASKIHFQKCISIGEDRYETLHRRKDGSIFDVEISVQYQSSEIDHFVVFIHDISERRKTEMEITKLTKGIEHSPATIIITDIKGQIEYANTKFCDLTGYSKEEALGKNPRILKSGEMSKEYYKELWDTILSGDEWRGELLNKKKNKELYWESASISPIFNVSGEISHFIAIKEDITERKKAEAELNKLYAELKISNELIEQNLYQKNALLEELSESEIKLKDTIATKDKFFSILAHDLRGPFTGFIGLTDLMAKEADELSVKEIKRMSEAINKSASSLFQLIDDLLLWSRTQTDLMPFFPERIDLYEIGFNAVFSLKQMALNKNIDIKLMINQNTIVFCDRNMITTVFRNLISNSIKFTNYGGSIKIGINQFSNLLNENLENSLLNNNSEICIYVKDNGIGIPKSDLQRLFKIDSSYTSTGTANEKGTGLGLIICAEFIKKHNGRIWVESQENKGCTFFFILPR